MTKKKDTKKTDWTRTRVGIDYSLTSPAVHIDDIKTGTFNFYYLTSKKKWTGKIGENIYGYEHKEWKDPIERFTYISDFVMDLLSNHNLANLYKMLRTSYPYLRYLFLLHLF